MDTGDRNTTYLFEDSHNNQNSRTPSPSLFRGSAGSRWAAEACSTELSPRDREPSPLLHVDHKACSSRPLQSHLLKALTERASDATSRSRVGHIGDANAGATSSAASHQSNEVDVATDTKTASSRDRSDPWGAWQASADVENAGEHAYRQRVATTASMRDPPTPRAIISPPSEPSTVTNASAHSLSGSGQMSSVSTQKSRQQPIGTLPQNPKLQAPASAAPNSSPSPSVAEDDPWATWAGNPQAEAGGAAAFRSRQLMGVGHRSTAPDITVPSSSSSATAKLTSSPAPSQKKKGKVSTPVLHHGKKQPLPIITKQQKASITIEPPGPIPKLAAKKQGNASSPPLPPRTPTKKAVTQPLSMRDSTPPMCVTSAVDIQASTEFPAGSLLAQIASSPSGRPRTPEHQSLAVEQANLSLNRIQEALEQTSEETALSGIDDLLSGDDNHGILGPILQSSIYPLADELAGLSFDDDNECTRIHTPLLGLGLSLNDDSPRRHLTISPTGVQSVPCLIIDEQDGTSDGGSPITPLQPVRALSFFFSNKAATPIADRIDKQSRAEKPPLPLNREIRLENAVKAFGYQEQMASRVVELLKTLSKKDQATCLFNQSILKEKIAGAIEVIRADEESEEEL